jgi:hypothetical protein
MTKKHHNPFAYLITTAVVFMILSIATVSIKNPAGFKLSMGWNYPNHGLCDGYYHDPSVGWPFRHRTANSVECNGLGVNNFALVLDVGLALVVSVVITTGASRLYFRLNKGRLHE